MLNRLQAASRLLIRASLALFTAVVLLLIQSAFWSNRVSAWMQAIIVATALLSYFRPQYGLLALAVLAPLGQVGSRTLDSQMRGAEALVLAFLAGALVRGWTLREFRTFPSTRLEIAALAFAFVVAASCLEQIWYLQIQRDFPWPFAQELFAYASRNYLTGYRDFSMIFHAMLLLEGLALMVYTSRYVRRYPPYALSLLTGVTVGAIASATFNLNYLAQEVLENRDGAVRFFDLFFRERFSAFTNDVNAAGSFFGLAIFLAFGLALKPGRFRLAWIAGGLTLFVALWMTYSRTALVAVMLTAAYIPTRAALRRFLNAQQTIAVITIGVIIACIALWMFMPEGFLGASATQALTIRKLLLETTGRMLTAEPLFGVGVGQYMLWSHSYASPELLGSYQRENAHNNFAQVAGELGLIGLIAFVVTLASSVWRHPHIRQSTTPTVTAAVLGVSVFVLTWLGGHPLLVPQVAYGFWLVLGVSAALWATNMRAGAVGIAGVSCVLLLASIPFRVAGKSSQINFARVNYGVSARQMMTSRARFFVPATERRVEFPLRARGASDGDPVEIEVFIDGSASQNITITNRNWQRARIELSGETSSRFRQIDFQIKPLAVDDLETRPPVEVGNWEIISKPNG